MKNYPYYWRGPFVNKYDRKQKTVILTIDYLDQKVKLTTETCDALVLGAIVPIKRGSEEQQIWIPKYHIASRQIVRR